jgi:hypothetical protein
MAALAVSSMPYRNFVDVSPPPSSGRTVQLAVDFPLLLAALPEIALFPIPHPPAAPLVPHDRPGNPPLAFELATTEAAGVATIVPAETPDGHRQSCDLPTTSQQAASLAGQTGSFPIDLQVRRDPALRAPKQRPALVSLVTIHAERTPLGAVFRTLRAAGPDIEKRHESQSQLQNMFDLL